LALLKILALGNKEIEAGQKASHAAVSKRIRARLQSNVQTKLKKSKAA
jgi:hypothetical protein